MTTVTTLFRQHGRSSDMGYYELILDSFKVRDQAKAQDLFTKLPRKYKMGLLEAITVGGWRSCISEQNTRLLFDWVDAKPIVSLPRDTLEQVNAGKVTYRGCGMGKNARNRRIKVHGKEYMISSELFKEMGGHLKMRFEAPYRRG